MTAPSRAAIVVLGAALRPDGAPGPALARRAAHAARLFAAGAAATVIASGGRGESRALAAALAALGVPPAALVEEDRSRTTFENAANVIPLMRARGLARAIVVSDRYHLPRAVMTFRLLGMPATGSAPAERPGWCFLARALPREAAALPWYVVRALARRWLPRRPGAAAP